MLRPLSLSCCFALASLGTAQTAWMKAVGNVDYDRIHAVQAVGDTIFAAGSKDEASGDPKAWLLAMDFTGTPILDVIYLDAVSTPMAITHLTPAVSQVEVRRRGVDVRVGDRRSVTHPGEVRLFAAAQLGSTFGDRDLVVLALDLRGHIVWQRVLDFPGNATVGDMAGASDGGLVVVGSRTDPLEFRAESFALKLDRRGDVAWHREFATDSHDLARSALVLQDGSYLLAGQVGVGKSMDEYQGWMARLGPGGRVQWQKGYNFASSDALFRVLPFGGGYLAVGSMANDSFFRGDAWLLFTDDQGTPTRNQWMGNFDFLGHDELVDLVPTASGGVVALGSTNSVNGPFEQMWAVEFDSLAQVVWARHYGGGSFDWASSVAQGPDGGYLFGGWTQHPSTIFDGFVVRTDATGAGFSACGRFDDLRPVPTDIGVTVTNLSVSHGRIDSRASDYNIRRIPSASVATTLCTN